MWSNGQEEMVTKPTDDKQKPKAPDWLIENIAEASKNARKIYFLYIGFLAYCALTVVSTSDRQIILNETVSLPILRLDVSLNVFFILTPLIAIFVFSYLQLYLSTRKDLINSLKRDFPSIGGEYLYPWILVVLDYPKQGLIGKLQSAIVKFSLWISLPLVLILIAILSVKKHDPILSYAIGSAVVVGSAVVLWFWCHYEGSKLKIKQLPKFVLKNLGKTAFVFILLVFEILFLFFIIPLAMEGGEFKWLNPFIYVDLSYQKLITEPEKDYKGLFWGNFNKAHLAGADLTSTVLERADFRNANLQYALMSYAMLEEADLEYANLQKAILVQANLQEAYLGYANLQKAILVYANLQEANLEYANLQEADLGYANLQKAILWGANLQEANLVGANLQEANLEYANLQGVRNLTIEQLSKVKTLYKAELDSDLQEKIRKDYRHLLEVPED